MSRATPCAHNANPPPASWKRRPQPSTRSRPTRSITAITNRRNGSTRQGTQISSNLASNCAARTGHIDVRSQPLVTVCRTDQTPKPTTRPPRTNVARRAPTRSPARSRIAAKETGRYTIGPI